MVIGPIRMGVHIKCFNCKFYGEFYQEVIERLHVKGACLKRAYEGEAILIADPQNYACKDWIFLKEEIKQRDAKYVTYTKLETAESQLKILMGQGVDAYIKPENDWFTIYVRDWGKEKCVRK